MAKAKRKARCHVCGEENVALTQEHIPPQSAGNDKWAYAHTLQGLAIGAEHKIPPPPLEGRDGIKRRTLCYDCNRLTAEWYNEAFKDWTQQAGQYIATAGDKDAVEITFHEVKPLSIIKQIATFALATAEFGIGPAEARLRRFVRYTFENVLPADFQVRTYLNPPRIGEDDDKLLTTKRLSSGCISFNTVAGTALHNFAEIAHNPLGYLIHFTKQDFPLPKEVLELTDISFFGNYRWGSKTDIRLKLPVRNPFGPVPGYYAKLTGPGTWHSVKPPPVGSG